VSFHQAQVALARVYVGSDDVKGGVHGEVVNIEQPHDGATGADKIGKKDTVEKAVRLPETIEEVSSLITPCAYRSRS
jgi:phospholipase D1/2